MGSLNKDFRDELLADIQKEISSLDIVNKQDNKTDYIYKMMNILSDTLDDMNVHVSKKDGDAIRRIFK